MSIFLDSGPVISLSMNSLLWVLEALQKQPNISFSIVSSVKREIMDRPLATKKFKFEALQVERLIEQGTLKVIDKPEFKSKALQLLDLANNALEGDFTTALASMWKYDGTTNRPQPSEISVIDLSNNRLHGTLSDSMFLPAWVYLEALARRRHHQSPR